ncbi:DUF4387 family protein [Streptomyces atroolivaceus]|uniref:DUF4387 family protein n=1 Tax=Streptomyces atroolivaceus TaxID=66869 RepID=UPI0024E16887|nr:DUF4387 family protein [Streptomyces atroolivaceus]
MELCILAPTGALGAGFDASAFATGVAARPDVIACDAGSTDSGPAALGSGTPKLSAQAVTRDLRILLRARDQLGVPLVIGSCGTSGRDVGVDWVADIARAIAAEEKLHFKLGLIYSDQSTERLEELYDAGRITPLANAPEIDRELFGRSHPVAMMGVEPIQEALQDGCDVILAGRASDTALFAALPHLKGADPGLTWHMAKTIECGAACAIPPSANGLLVTLREDHFDVTALADGSRLTSRSVAAHTLCENADPFHIAEPSGVLDTTDATYEAVDDRTVRVRGARYVPADGYTNKLEGAELVGYQTVIIDGVRDRIIIDTLPELLPMAKHYFDAKIEDIFSGEVAPPTSISTTASTAPAPSSRATSPTRWIRGNSECSSPSPRRTRPPPTSSPRSSPTPAATCRFPSTTAWSPPSPTPTPRPRRTEDRCTASPSTTSPPASPPPNCSAPPPRSCDPMTSLLDYCSLVRSKNAGPFTLTFDFMCHDEQAYEALVATGFLNKQLFAPPTTSFWSTTLSPSP